MPDRLPGRPVGGRATCPVEVIVEERGWRRAIPGVGRLARRAVAAAGGADTVVLSSDRAVRRLNFRHRGKNRPTNVLTFEPVHADGRGELVLALETLRREARAAGRGLADHFAHLLVHGALHLRGEDHARAGEARRMEMLEARILHRLGVANPWKGR